MIYYTRLLKVLKTHDFKGYWFYKSCLKTDIRCLLQPSQSMKYIAETKNMISFNFFFQCFLNYIGNADFMNFLFNY